MKRFAVLFLICACAIGAGAQPLAPNEGYVILNGLPIYSESFGKLEFIESLVIGDKVSVESKISKFKQDGKEREYVKVKAPSGKVGWARSAYVVQKAALGVVKTDKAIVYSEPRDVKITSKTISVLTIAAVMQDSPAAFAKIVCYDQAQDAYYTDPVYIAKEDISTADADVNATILYVTAMATKNKDIRANLLKVIEKRYSASQFFSRIQSALAPAPIPVTNGGKATVPAAGSFTVNDDNVNVRSQPDEKAGEVTAKLNKGTVVQVSEATGSSYTVAGSTAVWYRLSEPAGWVFGSFLTQNQ